MTAVDFGELDPPEVVTFTSTQFVDCVNIQITDDNTTEPAEFFNVQLSSTDVQVIINMDASSATVFIAISDGKIWS